MTWKCSVPKSVLRRSIKNEGDKEGRVARFPIAVVGRKTQRRLISKTAVARLVSGRVSLCLFFSFSCLRTETPRIVQSHTSLTPVPNQKPLSVGHETARLGCGLQVCGHNAG